MLSTIVPPLILSACCQNGWTSRATPHWRLSASAPDLARLFAGRDYCFEVYDLKADRIVLRAGDRRCAERVSPCSTFKVPLALMAFDRGVLEDERSPMKWDGRDRGRDVWNRDQTAGSWMKYSVVWFSQRLTPALGMKARGADEYLVVTSYTHVAVPPAYEP